MSLSKKLHSGALRLRVTKGVCLASLMLVSGALDAAQVSGAVGRVTTFDTYSDYGNGDVVFRVETPLPGCQHGFWIRMTDPGAKTLVAQLLAAFTAGTALQIWAMDNELWVGSGGQYCRTYLVRSLAP